MTERQNVGRRAEEIAARLLEERGIRIVARNWRRPGGEIDIVADEGGICAFVEVRSRTGTETGHPLETVDARKRAHIVRSARLYLDEENPRAAEYRFDVVAVVFAESGDVVETTYVPAAFALG